MKPCCPRSRRRTVEEGVERVRVDTHQASALAESALLIAYKLGGKEEIAHGLRAKGNALYASGDSKGAVHHHDQALQIYFELGNEKEAGRTISTLIQPLILMGEYERAFQIFGARPGNLH